MGSKQKEKQRGWGKIGRYLKPGKAGGTFWSMVITVVIYALIFPWTFSLGLVAMIFIHEMGHVWAAKRKGLPVSAPAFIPFVGALITLKKEPQDAVTEAYVAMGGPVLGTVGAFSCYLLYLWSGWEVLLPISLIGFILNLFNLLPIHPLDGGRIVTAISRWFWVVGLVAGLILIFYTFSILLVLIWLLFAYQLWDTYVPRRRSKARGVEATISLRRSLFEEAGVWIPGEKHQRTLPFVQYCTVLDQEHRCDIYYPGVGLIHRLQSFSGRMKQVQLLETHQGSGEEGGSIQLKLLLTYLPGAEEGLLRKDAAYYQVSARTRFGYGLVYFGLGAFLVYMVLQLTGFSLAGPTQVF